jgi:hypothetical protein
MKRCRKVISDRVVCLKKHWRFDFFLDPAKQQIAPKPSLEAKRYIRASVDGSVIVTTSACYQSDRSGGTSRTFLMARARSIAFSAATIAACLLCAWPITIALPAEADHFQCAARCLRLRVRFLDIPYRQNRRDRDFVPGKLFERFSRVRSCSDNQKDRPMANSLFASIQLHLLVVFFILVDLDLVIFCLLILPFAMSPFAMLSPLCAAGPVVEGPFVSVD